MYEYELEALAELEGEYEDEFETESEFESEFEWENESESEAESEAFFGSLARLARRAVSSPALRRIAQSAARAALNGIQTEAEYEREAEWETELETEAILNPIRRVYPDVLMEHFGHAAAAAESEAEAEAFVGALVPLARRAVISALPRVTKPVAGATRPSSILPRSLSPKPGVSPRTASSHTGIALRRITPQLVRGVNRVASKLRHLPGGRPLMRVLPTVVQRTVNALGQRAALDGSVTPNQALGTLARQTANVLGNPQQAVQAYQRSVAQDQGYHTASAPGLGLCPACQERICALCNCR